MTERFPAPRIGFEELQAAWRATFSPHSSSGLETGTIVVLPSITFPSLELRKIVGIQFYEERMLYTLLLLDNPELRVVYCTSVPIDPDIVSYYLSFVADEASARNRLSLISVGDPEPSALTEKILTRPSVVDDISAAIGDSPAYLLPFNVTPMEKDLAERLSIPLYGPHPDLVSLGSKSGSRRVAREANVPVLAGSEDLYSLDEVRAAIDGIRAERPGAQAVVVKLNNGFSGQGNAIVQLDGLGDSVVDFPTVFCAQEESWSSFAQKIAAEGAIVEELERSPGIASPSVQLRIAPGGSIETLSTHDQVLGGPDDQVYLGCKFPARSEYRRQILDLALETAKVLAVKGVFGAFGIDFVAVPREGTHSIYLSEINLRVGGTTHPFAMATLVTGGRYDFRSGELSAGGRSKSYVATDNLKSASYIGMRPRDMITALEEAGLAFERDTYTGATLHLMGALQEFGKIGALCIANSHEGAEELYNNVVATLDEAAASPS